MIFSFIRSPDQSDSYYSWTQCDISIILPYPPCDPQTPGDQGYWGNMKAVPQTLDPPEPPEPTQLPRARNAWLGQNRPGN